VKSETPNPTGTRKAKHVAAKAKRDAAAARTKARNGRSDVDQLALLEARGAGDCREATRIRTRLNPTHSSKQVKPKRVKP
jgi:hypothetical protein